MYTRETKEAAEKELQEFIDRNSVNYPKITGIFKNKSSLFSFYDYPVQIRKSIYTTNLIESNNKALKRKTKVKEQFPNEEATDRFFCSHYAECNKKYGMKKHKGFVQAESELMELLGERYHPDESDASEDAA